MATVRKIEAKPSLLLSEKDGTVRKRRVAAYARVSTEQEEQQSSYETQVNFYTNYIQSNPEWEFAGIYADEGISGTNTKHREGFKRMVDDALAGKIDLILTKSISRFARNTVDSLVTIRKLKEKGVEVYFEKENIYSMDSKGELMLTIMSSIAQEESRSISENVTWGKRKSMADGKVYMAYRGFLGYERGEDGKPRINEEEAIIVRRIYSMFLKGMGYREIANTLDREGIPTPMNGKCWRVRTILSILSNEKYKGDALLQKTYAVDWLNKKRGKNTGQLPQYYIEGSHPAIISPAVFDLVQNEIAKRKDQHKRNTGPFSNKIICGDCGAYYGRKVWHSKTKYKSHIWFCNSKYKGQHICKTPNIRDEQLKVAFIEVFNCLIEDKEAYISKAQKRINSLIDTSVLEKKLEFKEAEYDEAYKALKDLVDSNASRLQNQDDYTQRFNEAELRFQAIEKEISELNTEIAAIKAQQEKIAIYLDALKADDRIIEEFNEDLWYAFVDKITIYADNQLSFQFKDGSDMSISIDEKTDK
ncbi:recombinase family protein [uncultured Ruminococcus sp.]|uniref:recombinase family protein n=1 Tax=uncultured Ruminococcus sp. TaxID=165186 RepID=UPI0025D16121|nr:recombinase family protein [uncultured Ruminococcus sp.]